MITLILLSAFSAFLPNVPDLEQSIHVHYLSLAEIEVKALKEHFQKDRWADYLPSLGVSYTQTGAPRPDIRFTFSQVLNTRRKKREVLRLEEQIYQTYKVQAVDQIRMLHSAIEEVNELKRRAELAGELLDIERSIFEIFNAEFERADIGPRKFLVAKRRWVTVQAEYQATVDEVAKAERNVLMLAFWTE